MTLPQVRLAFSLWSIFPWISYNTRSLILTHDGWSKSPWPSFDPRLRPPYPRLVRETRVSVCVVPMLPVVLTWTREIPSIDEPTIQWEATPR